MLRETLLSPCPHSVFFYGNNTLSLLATYSWKDPFWKLHFFFFFFFFLSGNWICCCWIDIVGRSENWERLRLSIGSLLVLWQEKELWTASLESSTYLRPLVRETTRPFFWPSHDVTRHFLIAFQALEVNSLALNTDREAIMKYQSSEIIEGIDGWWWWWRWWWLHALLMYSEPNQLLTLEFGKASCSSYCKSFRKRGTLLAQHTVAYKNLICSEF